MEQTREVGTGTVARDLEGQVAFVTGGGTGIGRAISEALAARGAAVAIFARNAERAEAAAAALRDGGASARSFAADVSETDSVTGAFDAALSALGRVDILVNNAGVTRDGVFMRMSDEQWQEVLNTNLGGAYWMSASRAFLPSRRISRSSVAVSPRFSPTSSPSFSVAVSARISRFPKPPMHFAACSLALFPAQGSCSGNRT